MLITDLSIIGTRLRIIRKSRKLSQADLAVAAGISVKAYADIERGNVNMRVGTMLSICQALHILPNDLFTDEVDDINADYQELLLRLNSNSGEDNELVQNILHVIITHLKNTAENTIR